MRGENIHGRTSLVILCNASMMDSPELLTLYFTLTQISSGGKAKINLHTALNQQYSCQSATGLMRSCRHLGFYNVVRSTYAHHSLNARNFINWKCSFKVNKIKKILGRKNNKRSCIYKN